MSSIAHDNPDRKRNVDAADGRRALAEFEGAAGSTAAKTPKPVGGLLVNGRALAKAAIHLSRYPGALRVLVLIHEYMGPHGRCWVSSYTLAGRLEVSRQAVKKHIARLEAEGIIVTARKDGHALTFRWADAWLVGLSTERAGQQQAEASRAARRSVRGEVTPEVTPQDKLGAGGRQPQRLPGEVTPEVTPGGNPQRLPEVTHEETPEGGVSPLYDGKGKEVEKTGRVNAPSSTTPNIAREDDDGDPRLVGMSPLQIALFRAALAGR